ncbi:MAG TPA: DUF4157 domain-containing protein [Anseongella sp.]|nr:DUF4157 domain-containing protein [Anseongella sp.]
MKYQAEPRSAVRRKSDGGSRPGSFFASPAIQPKLTVNTPGDRYEKEADSMADKVMRMPGAAQPVQRKCAHCEEEEKKKLRLKPVSETVRPLLQRKAGEAGNSISPQVASSLNAGKGGGRPLPHKTRDWMESRFGTDFSSVKVHTDQRAAGLSRDLNAQAFTHGSSIYFNSGKFAPETAPGKRLLAHELTHVVQQNGAACSKGIQRTIGDGHDLTSPRMSGNLLFEAVFDNEKVIKKGDIKPEVRRVQQMLIDLGIPLPAFGADGDFGTETENAVKEFQRRNPPLADDGKVGFATIEALNNKFAPFTLPLNRSDPWTMSCILKILCPWNRNLVENVLPSFTVKTFDSREFPVETWNGASWDTSTFTSGGFRSRATNTIGLSNTTSCEEMSFVIYHEGWHAQQPSSLTGVVEIERDAYINAEQWSIDTGIRGQGTFTNEATGGTESFRTTRNGEEVVDETAADVFVRQEYGGVSAIPGEVILARAGASDVRVRRPDGSEYQRPAQVGESVRGSVVMTNLQTIDPANWVCP